MANNENTGADTGTTDGGQSAEQEINRFAGFSTKDGEVQKAVDAPSARVPNTGKGFTAKPAAKKDAEPEVDPDETPADKTKRESADKRIGQAVGRQRAAERRAEAAEARATATEARLANLEARLTAGTQPANPADKAPDPKDYEGAEYDARYIADLAKYEARKAVAEAKGDVRKEAQTTAQNAQQAQRTAEFKAKRDDFFEAAAEKYEDFEDVVADDDNPLSPTLGELAMDSDFGAQILYELAGDRKEAVRIAKLSPGRQAAWFGRQEARLEASEEPDETQDDGDDEPRARQSGPRSKVSKAPPVPEYSARGTGTVPKVSGATQDFAAFERSVQPKRSK